MKVSHLRELERRLTSLSMSTDLTIESSSMRIDLTSRNSTAGKKTINFSFKDEDDGIFSIENSRYSLRLFPQKDDGVHLIESDYYLQEEEVVLTVPREYFRPITDSIPETPWFSYSDLPQLVRVSFVRATAGWWQWWTDCEGGFHYIPAFVLKAGEVNEENCVARQGHFLVFPKDALVGNDFHFSPVRSGEKFEFLNHCIGSGVSYYRPNPLILGDFILWAVEVNCPTIEVISPDHDPISIREGRYWFVHRIPPREGNAD